MKEELIKLGVFLANPPMSFDAGPVMESELS